MSPQCMAYWARFKASHPSADDSRLYESFCFGDSEALANELGALVVAGTKRATAGSAWALEAEQKTPPKPGDLSIVTTWSGEPLCVIETTRVDIVPFAEVGAEFAATEGEGDGSLAYWRAAHKRYFVRECARLGRPFTSDMPVVCERFKVVSGQAPQFVSASGEPVASIQLRRGVSADAAAIADCVARAYEPWVPRIGREPWPMLQDYAAVVRDGCVTVAEADGEVAGVLVLSRTDEGLLIDNVAAHPRWKGRGVGRMLLRHAEQEARRLACSNVYLYTNELMVENIALYARYGYVEYDRRQEQGFRRVFMRKAVPAAERLP